MFGPWVSRSLTGSARGESLLLLAEYSPYSAGTFVTCLEQLAPAARSVGLLPVLGLPISDEPRTWHARLSAAGWTIAFLQRPWGVRSQFIAHSARLVRSTKPALIHVNFHAETLVALMIAEPLARARRIMHWHNPPTARGAMLTALDVVCAPVHLTAGEWLAEAMKLRLPRAASRIVPVPNGVLIPKEVVVPRNSTLLTISAFRSQKDPDTLLAALEILRENGVPFKLIWAGVGPDRERVEKLSAEKKLSRHVEFLGAVDNVGLLYERCSIFVLSTHYEGQPYVVLEAMAHCRPVVATDVPGVRECLGTDAEMLCVPPRDPQALARRLMLFLGDPRLAWDTAERLRVRAMSVYSVGRWVERVAEVYHHLLAT